MKLKFFLLLLVIINAEIIGQKNQDTIFYSDDWRVTSREYASYYRITDFDILNKCFSGNVQDFTFEQNIEIMNGHYQNCQRNGRFSITFENGDSALIHYINGKRADTWSRYNAQGKLIKQCRYDKNLEYIFYYSSPITESKVVNGNGQYYEERIYHPQEKIYSIEGEVIDSLKNGKWIIRNSKDEILITEKYKNGVFVKSKLNLSNNEYDMKFLTQEFSIFSVPEKLNITESLLVETGVPIKQNQILVALKERTDELRGIKQRSNSITGISELERFLDDKILFNRYEASNYLEDDTIIIQFSHKPDFSVDNFSLLKPTTIDALDEEILTVLNSIYRIELNESFTKPRKVKFIYRLKLQDELPMPILD